MTHLFVHVLAIHCVGFIWVLHTNSSHAILGYEATFGMMRALLELVQDDLYETD